MNCKFLLIFAVAICVFASLEAASLRETAGAVQKLDYEGVQANVRSARQSYAEADSDEDSDEDDDEDDAETQHQAIIRHQQAYQQSVDNSQEGSDEDNLEEDDDGADDGDDYFGRRIKRAAGEQPDSSNEIKEDAVTAENLNKEPVLATSETAPLAVAAGSSNTSVLILIRDVIKKVSELPNSQQVATSAQQYFQMFEHLLQQTIEQVIGGDDDDDDDGDETEATTIVAEATEKESQQSEKQPALNEAGDEGNSNDLEPSQAEHKPQAVDEVKA